jgi:beta-N-acetylhexosaminidase
MGTRAAVATVEGVVEYGRQFLAGLAAQGVVGCGKHFPGLGGGTLDSHLETPSIHRTLSVLNREDLAPYRELRNELPMIMVNHAAYPKTPGGNLPASASSYWITTVLRKQIGYRGIIFSDDLEMGGILKFLPIEQAAIASIRAGIDLLEICHSPELILRAYESLLVEAERSAVFRGLLLKRSRNISTKRTKLFGGAAAALSTRQFEALRTRIQRFSETIAKAQLAPETKPE